MMQLLQALAWLPGATLAGDGSLRVQRVHSDTRSLLPGDLFVALKGDVYDANRFIAQAAERGAVAALAHRGALPPGFPGIEVDDTRVALGQLAAGWRAQFALPLIAVTGSNGKTTVTQMVAAILRAWQDPHGAPADSAGSLATQGNFNNDIGLPLTLLRLRPKHRVAVVELGMNHVGEIARLAALARPTVALVNNAQREHQEFMASVEAVAAENGAVLKALPGNGVAVFPADDAFAPLWQAMAGGRACLGFGLGGDVDLMGAWWQPGDGAAGQAPHWQMHLRTPAGPVETTLHIAGRHNLRNAMAAAACALAAGAPLAAIAQGLSAFEPVKGRSRALSVSLGGRSLQLVDDSYNANPDSVRAAIDLLAQLPGPRLLVLGDMGEVGDQGPQYHAEVGAYARQKKIENMHSVGDQSAQAAISFVAGRHFTNFDDLLAATLAELPKVASVLVKGSRFMQMERVVEAITAHAVCEQKKTEQGGALHAA